MQVWRAKGGGRCQLEGVVTGMGEGWVVVFSKPEEQPRSTKLTEGDVAGTLFGYGEGGLVAAVVCIGSSNTGSRLLRRNFRLTFYGGPRAHGESTAELQREAQHKHVRRFLPILDDDEICTFQNIPRFRSVPELAHAHVFLRPKLSLSLSLSPSLTPTLVPRI